MDIQYNGLSARAVQADVSVGPSAASALVATMPAAVGWQNVLTGWDISGLGATVGVGINVTVTGCLVNPTSVLAVQAGVLLPGITAGGCVRFPNGRPASAPNTAITVTVPSFGLGNTGAAINLYGYRVPA